MNKHNIIIANKTYNAHINHFNCHFLGKPGLSCCLLDFHSPAILIVSVLRGQANNLRSRHVLRRPPSAPCSLALTATNNMPMVFEVKAFTGWMPFQLPNQQHQSTEGSNETSNRQLHIHFFCIPMASTSFSSPRRSFPLLSQSASPRLM